MNQKNIKKLYDDSIEESKKCAVERGMKKEEAVKENEELKKRLEYQNFNMFETQQRSQLFKQQQRSQLFNENNRLKEEVKHTQRYWNTIIAKDEEVKLLEAQIQEFKKKHDENVIEHK